LPSLNIQPQRTHCEFAGVWHLAERIHVSVYALQKLIRDIGLEWDIRAIKYGAVRLELDCPGARIRGSRKFRSA
jgi:hypothetical protein